MGLFGSLKRLLFTTESIAKSAVDKTVDFTKEKAGDFADAAKETVADISDKTAGLRVRPTTPLRLVGAARLPHARPRAGDAAWLQDWLVSRCRPGDAAADVHPRARARHAARPRQHRGRSHRPHGQGL